MKMMMSVAAVFLAAASLTLLLDQEARAGCRAGSVCEPAVLLPAPQPIPLHRRWRHRRAVVASCTAPCASQPVAAEKGASCAAPCRVPKPRAYYYKSENYYANYTQPADARSCNQGPGNCFWLSYCWYDSFGRKFCN